MHLLFSMKVNMCMKNQIYKSFVYGCFHIPSGQHLLITAIDSCIVQMTRANDQIHDGQPKEIQYMAKALNKYAASLIKPSKLMPMTSNHSGLSQKEDENILPKVCK